MNDVLSATFQKFAAACANLAAPAWRVDHIRREWSSPADPALQHFASCPELIDCIAGIACKFDSSPDGTVVAPLVPDVWLILVRERVRSRSYSWVATLAPTASALANGELCAISPQIEPLRGSLPCSLHRASVADFAQAQARAALLAEIHHQFLLGSIDGQSIDQFTDQLTVSYEYTTMLSRVGRLMGDISRPDAFITAILDELYQASEFAWVAFVRPDDPAFEAAGVPKLRVRFDSDRFTSEQVEAAARVVRSIAPGSTEPTILEHLGEVPEELGPEVVALTLVDAERPVGLLAMGARTGKEWAVSSHDTTPVQAVGACVTAYLRIVRLYQVQRDSFKGTLRAFSTALDAKDNYTQGHSERVATLARMIARSLRLDPQAEECVYIAGIVHDIGKIGVPETLLCGDRKMSADEFAVMKTHPQIGERILRDVPLLADALPGVLYHHERWDGNGYPTGLAGEQIPLIARILAIADSFDAMSSTRTYRAGQDRQRVLDEIRRCAGKQFDAELVDVFLALDLEPYDRMLARAEQAQAAQPHAA